MSVNVDDQPRVWPLQTPTTFFATPFDGDMVAQHLSAKNWPVARQVSDATGLASGALIYRIELSAHASKTISLEIPMSGEPASTLQQGDMQAWVDAQREQVARGWREKLNRVTFKVPPDAQPIIDTLRTALAHILISRDGVQIRPGTRSLCALVDPRWRDDGRGLCCAWGTRRKRAIFSNGLRPINSTAARCRAASMRADRIRCPRMTVMVS
ncbi:MAG: hypothetical protein IPP82_08570 [Xanthomonadales bacterium]|nr:hypothetical protein [Xanthomonadales bacterium]